MEQDDSLKNKSPVALKEEEILAFWDKNAIFKKSLEKKSPRGEFVFYDGPPFATGLPHYGHLLQGFLKDAIPRYKTMRGYHVRREWGWDCHGLPAENLVEKELELKTKKDIEIFGIEKFNEAARKIVLRFTDDWRKIIPRTGRWIDMKNDYRTMDPSYTESVWWAFKTLYDKGLAYEGFKAMQLCPRCETTLSNFEVSQGYVDIVDFAITVKFRLKDEPDTFVLAWTTTPWTLPGNMALAIKSDALYGKFEILNPKSETEKGYYIIAKDRAEDVFLNHEYKFVEELTGESLIGKTYAPPFGYYTESPIKNKENGWKIYQGSFVSLSEGTGIVHIAPAFGEDDLRLAKEKNIPIVHHVGKGGTFKKEVLDFALMQVKPKGDHQKTDIEIIKNLAHRGLLFAKEKITHSYPHCWRCETPLLNYAASSWFIKVTAIKDKIVAQNKKVRWVPDEVRLGRFGKWLEGARDWAISRSRYWGAPIPVWKCGTCERLEVVGSFKELSKKTARSSNQYFLMRHGEAENNVRNIVNANPRVKMLLTEKGRKDVLRSARFLKSQSIDVIFSSPLERAKETAFILAPEAGIKREKVIFDERLREIGFGMYEGKDADAYRSHFSSRGDKFEKGPPGGESLGDVRLRMASFLYEVDQKYANKNILIVSHDDSLWMLAAAAEGADNEGALALVKRGDDFLKNAEIKKIHFSPLPHGSSFELDVHRPFIDSVKFACACGGKMRRVPEVFDCWFESGAMPFAQFHYPFDSEKGKPFEKIFNPQKKIGFPAHFIAEALDQVRGWFYSLLVLNVGLFGVSPYKTVIASGLVLAEDGRKMSKRLNNYPDPLFIMNQYGADALRLYLLNSPVVRAEDLNFSEKGVHEVQNKMITRLKNVLAFYDLYADKALQATSYKLQTSPSVLDRWILIRLDETVNQVTYALEEYSLDKALRPVSLFLDDLSTWYLRRSRKRFKEENLEDKTHALATMWRVLHTFSRVLAPFAPFVSEEVYQKVRSESDPLSVHLEVWPQKSSRIPVWPNVMALFHRIFGTHDGLKELTDMEEVRHVVSRALLARMAAGIKVRQPVASLKIKNQKSKIKDDEALLQLIKDEVNVKEIFFGEAILGEVEIDTVITPELKKEGQVRDIIRQIQDLRKEKGLVPEQKVILIVETNESGKRFIKEFEPEIKKAASLREIQFKEVAEGKEFVFDITNFRFQISDF